jgi:hypothetical protein
MVVFGVGAATGVMANMAMGVQKAYYRNARDQKRQFEDTLALGEHALKTTVSMGGIRSRIGRITTFQRVILSALVIADLTGFGVALEHAARRKIPAVEVAAQVSVRGRAPTEQIPLVFRHGSDVVAALVTVPGTVSLVRVKPGAYEIVGLAGALCRTARTITSAPLQRVVLECGHAAPRRATRRARRSRRRGP